MADTSLAMKYSLSPSPTRSGLPLRAATILCASTDEMTAIPYVPSTCQSASSTASSRLPSKHSSMRCASTSVSVSEVKT